MSCVSHRALLSGESLNYLGIGGFVIAGKQGIAVIAACQAVLMGGPEYARYVGIRSLEPVGVYLPGGEAAAGCHLTVCSPGVI